MWRAAFLLGPSHTALLFGTGGDRHRLESHSSSFMTAVFGRSSTAPGAAAAAATSSDQRPTQGSPDFNERLPLLSTSLAVGPGPDEASQGCAVAQSELVRV
ncbi:unnamed protein product [Durusdinium trenchii]|uniref:Secreted protein n=1 Tax=Durusdinium trenchii TaxID=1381693 RepID=A0ABP0QXY3_9DINO